MEEQNITPTIDSIEEEKMQEPLPSFGDLPTEVTFEILLHLSPFDLCKMSMLSKTFYTIIESQCLWKELFGRYNLEWKHLENLPERFKS